VSRFPNITERRWSRYTYVRLRSPARLPPTSGVDMVAKWQAPVAFYDRLKKPVIAKIMTEALGKAAADNCAKMKKGDLAAAAAKRMAGRGWLPPALVIAEPPAEVAQERPVSDDDGDEDDEAAEFEEEEAA
jgi:ParB family transcriptional regulator, chromosome partitioning protein